MADSFAYRRSVLKKKTTRVKISRGPRIEPCGTPCNRRKMGGINIIKERLLSNQDDRQI